MKIIRLIQKCEEKNIDKSIFICTFALYKTQYAQYDSIRKNKYIESLQDG